MPSNHLILGRPLLLLPSIFPIIRVFTSGLALCIRWPKYWSFSFSISVSNEYSGLISFRMDWLDLLAVQGTFKNIYACNSRVAFVSLSCVFERMIQVTTEVFRRGQPRLCCPRGRCRHINPYKLCLSGGRGVCVTKTTAGVMTFTMMFTE